MAFIITRLSKLGHIKYPVHGTTIITQIQERHNTVSGSQVDTHTKTAGLAHNSTSAGAITRVS